MNAEELEFFMAKEVLWALRHYPMDAPDTDAQRLAVLWAALELECQRQGLPLTRMIDVMKDAE